MIKGVEKIWKKKIKCFNRLLEKVLEFEHDKYFIYLCLNSWLDNVELFIRDKESFNVEIRFTFCRELLSVENIKVLTEKIIKLLSNIEECTDIESIKANLPFESYNDIVVDIIKANLPNLLFESYNDIIVDIDKFIKEWTNIKRTTERND